MVLVSEGLLDERLNFAEVRNRGIAIIECLKDHCLLEKSRKKEKVKMHDIVRDVAMWIASSLEKEDESDKVRTWPKEDNKGDHFEVCQKTVIHV